jgi:fibrillarin-like rRNA methylase
MSVIDDFLNKKQETAEKWLPIISDMSNDESYAYASDTLDGIYDDVCEEGRITDAQIQAVENIRNKPSQNYGRRRY